MINDKDIYDLRILARNLYKKESREILDKDLTGSILEVREKFKSVESISVDVDSFSIRLELKEDTKEKEVDKVLTSINEKLTDYIISTGGEQVKQYHNIIDNITPKSNLLCDVLRNGNKITYNL